MKSEKKIIIAGNHLGINQLLKCIPNKDVSAIIVPYNRPESINYLKFTSFFKQIPLIIHQKNNTDEYKIFLEKVSDLNCNLLISNSYPLIFKKDFIDIFKNNAFNVHSSFLPENRGCEPIQWAIIKAQKTTGVTIHQIDNNIDTGNIIFQSKVEIDYKDTWISLSEKIQNKKIELLKSNYNNLITSNFTSIAQDLKSATKNKKIMENDLKINFNEMSDLQIYNLIRANISPSNSAFILFRNKKIFFRKFVEFEKIKELRKEFS